MQRLGSEDKRHGFPKMLFYGSKSIAAAAAADVKKTAVLTLSSKQVHKKTFQILLLFWFFTL
jgi:hypothetical protein